ncbi:MAG: DUF309 domain-containing protein, partial [Cryobacterium sp.]|nr:DUF309 domain-containing protein [Oligoflexia bacterium]
PTAHHLDAWETGARLFNAGLYFQAHEIWEFRWRHLRPPDRAQVQAAILVCGCFVLIGKERMEPASRLAVLATVRFSESAAEAELFQRRPRLELPGSDEALLRVLAKLRSGEMDAEKILWESRSLRAHVRKGE